MGWSSSLWEAILRYISVKTKTPEMHDEGPLQFSIQSILLHRILQSITWMHCTCSLHHLSIFLSPLAYSILAAQSARLKSKELKLCLESPASWPQTTSPSMRALSSCLSSNMCSMLTIRHALLRTILSHTCAHRCENCFAHADPVRLHCQAQRRIHSQYQGCKGEYCSSWGDCLLLLWRMHTTRPRGQKGLALSRWGKTVTIGEIVVDKRWSLLCLCAMTHELT